MSNLGVLIRNNFALYKGKLYNKKKKASFPTILLVVFFALLCFSTGAQAFGYIVEFQEKELPVNYAIYSILLTSVLYICLIIVLKGTSVKKSNDFDLLYSLPIKKWEIVVSKLLSDYIFDCLFIVIALIPGSVVYMINCDPGNGMIVFNMIILVLLLGLLSNAMSLLIRVIISFITKNMKNKDIIRSIINTVIMITFFGFYYYNLYFGVSSITKYESDSYALVRFVADFIVNSKFVNFIVIALCCIGPFVISTWIYSATLGMKEKQVKNNDKVEYSVTSIQKSLFKNEIKRYFKSSLYVSNTIFGCVFTIALGVAILFFNGSTAVMKLFADNNIFFESNAYAVFCSLVGALMMASVCTTASSISMEGSTFWILKVNPISFKDIALAKIKVNYIIGFGPLLLYSIFTSIAFGFSFVGWLFMIIVPQLCFIYVILSGLYFNLRHNNIHFTDEQQVIKQGTSIFLTIMINPLIFIGLLIAGLFLMFLMNAYLVMLIILLVIGLIVFIRIRKLMIKGPDLFNQID